MRQYVNQYQKPQTATSRRHTISRKVTAGPVALSFVAIALLFIVGSAYLYIQNHLTTRGYEVRDLEKQVEALKDQNRKLEIQSAQSRSIEELQKSATQKLNMIEIASVRQLERTPSTVVIAPVLKP